MLFAEWRSLFHLAHDDVSKQEPIRERKKALGAIFGIEVAENDNETEYRALYALQTAYAIIVKCIALNVLASIRSHDDLIDFHRGADARDEEIREKLAHIEDGDLLRSLGFTNLLEGDFFAWYCAPAQWRPNSVGRAVRSVFAVLSSYEEQPFLNATETAVDFFKDLYTAIMPDKVRHSLGEYYTPPWLADLVVGRALELAGPNKRWRGIDTCCGSGTFVTTMLRAKLVATRGLPDRERLAEVVECVKGIDLNPLAVLTARINYFINISGLLHDDDRLEIPVYLGDASYVPEPVQIGGVSCFRYQIATIENPWPENKVPDGYGSYIDVAVPSSGLRDIPRFSEAMANVERHIERLDEEAIVEEISSICDAADLVPEVIAALDRLATQFVTLEKKKWNGIWARIVTDFLTTAALGRFDVVAGNPPWIDWRNLPSSYRDRIKGLCLDRGLFSGDGLTGGINLNVCALITSVAAGNWLSSDGVLAFLMPDSLLVQSTYRGFRELRTLKGTQLQFMELHDWSSGGKPFAPVGQNFYAYFIGPKGKDTSAVPLRRYVKKRNDSKAIPPILPLADYRRVTTFREVEHVFDTIDGTATPISDDPRKGFLLETSGSSAMPDGIAGEGGYTARQGLEFFPKSVFMMEFRRATSGGRATFSRFGHPTDQHLLETKFMYPMIQGARIRKFAPPIASAYVPFAYTEGMRSPIPSSKGAASYASRADTLSSQAPKMLEYFGLVARTLNQQSLYNGKIAGKHNTEVYAVARVGAYTYADHFVAFRDNTTWAACVASAQMTPWDELKRPLFQKHAVTISQRPDGTFITQDEAHYICAIMNSTSVERFVMASSDKRGFKIRLPFRIPLFDPSDRRHTKLSRLSRIAHRATSKPQLAHVLPQVVARACAKADVVYRELLLDS